MEIICIRIADFKKVTEKDSKAVMVTCDGVKQKILFSIIKVGYGQKAFFLCPICGKNKEKLYLENKLFRCSECCSLNFYRGIQNTTKGGDAYIAYKMQRFAQRCGIGKFEYPFDFRKYPRPKGKHKIKWEKNLAIMQSLENMRSQSIFFNKVWDSKTIQSVEQGKNKFLSFPLPMLERNLYAFDSGVLKNKQMTHL